MDAERQDGLPLRQVVGLGESVVGVAGQQLGMGGDVDNQLSEHV